MNELIAVIDDEVDITRLVALHLNKENFKVREFHDAKSFYLFLDNSVPDLLILDEPVSGLDAKSVRVFKEILEMHVERGGAVLFSTHIMEVAEDLCDRIAIINKGKFVGIGTMEELRQQSDKLGASLEDVFLRLTEQDASVKDIVKKLRKSYKKKIEEAA